MGLISNVIATKWKSGEFGIKPNWLARNTGVRIGSGIAIASGVGYHVYNAINDCLSNPIAGYDDLTYPIIAGAAVLIAALTTEISVRTVPKTPSLGSAGRAKGTDKPKSKPDKTVDKAKAAADRLDQEIKAAEAAANAAPKPVDFLANIDFLGGLDKEPDSESERQTGVYDGGRKSVTAGAREHAIDADQAEQPTVEVGSEELETVLMHLDEGQAGNGSARAVALTKAKQKLAELQGQLDQADKAKKTARKDFEAARTNMEEAEDVYRLSTSESEKKKAKKALDKAVSGFKEAESKRDKAYMSYAHISADVRNLERKIEEIEKKANNASQKQEAKPEPKPVAKAEQDDEFTSAEKTRVASAALYPSINALINALDTKEARKRITILLVKAIEGNKAAIKSLNDVLEDMTAEGAITDVILANALLEAAKFLSDKS